MRDDSPLFPGSFVDQRQFDLARKRLETQLFAHKELLAPVRAAVSQIPHLPQSANPDALHEWAETVLSFLRQPPLLPKPREGRRSLVVGHCPYDFLPPPSTS